MLKIKEHRDETPSIKTIRFFEKLDADPGQFAMVWVPGVDEFPMSISYAGKHFGITYQVVGDGTKALAKMRVGEKIGIRGPYGRGFEIKGKRLLVVAGGTGMAALGLLVEAAKARRSAVDLVLGARTSKELLFEARAKRAGARVHVSTDDGSKGFKGLATELAKSALDDGEYDLICACGPERMIVGLLRIAKGRHMKMQASLERMMKCGIGICDSCALDGKHVCKDGPVFDSDELEAFEELGKTKLDLSGRKTPI